MLTLAPRGVSAHLLLWMSRWRCREKGVRNRALHSSHWNGLSSEWVCRKERGMFTMCKRSRLSGDSDEDDRRRLCVFGLVDLQWAKQLKEA